MQTIKGVVKMRIPNLLPELNQAPPANVTTFTFQTLFQLAWYFFHCLILSYYRGKPLVDCPTQLTIIFMILHLYMSWQTLKLQIWKTQQGNLLGSPSTTNWMTFWRFPRGVLAWPGPRGWGVGESFPIKKKYVADLLCSKRICWSLDTYKTWL